MWFPFSFHAVSFNDNPCTSLPVTADGEAIQSPLPPSVAAFFVDVAAQECALKGDEAGDGSSTRGEQPTSSEEERDEKSTVLFSPMYQFFDNSGECMYVTKFLEEVGCGMVCVTCVVRTWLCLTCRVPACAIMHTQGNVVNVWFQSCFV